MVSEEKAEKAFQKALDKVGRLVLSEDWAGAVVVCDRVLAIRADSSFTWFMRGGALLSLDRYQEAVAIFDEVFRLESENVNALVSRGWCLRQLEKYQEAVASYEEAFKLEPDFVAPKLWESRMEALWEREKWVKARLPPQLHVDVFLTVTAVEEKLHLFVRQTLKRAYGEEESGWWFDGVPADIRTKCVVALELDPRRRPHAYNYTYLIDLKQIVEKRWKHFEQDFERARKGAKSKDYELKTKADFLKHLTRLNEIRNEVMHPVRGGLTEDDLKFAKWMRKVIETFTAEMKG